VKLSNKADTRYGQGNYTQGAQFYDNVLAIDPNDSSALNGKGDALRGQRNYTHPYDKALAVNPEDTYALTGKGNALYYANDERISLRKDVHQLY